MNFVLDASVTLTWFFEDEQHDYANEVKGAVGAGDIAVVPALWRIEVANGLIVAERSKRITQVKVESALAALTQLARAAIVIRELDVGTADLAGLARRFTISAYDACYLHLAEALGLPLASIDAGLERARQAAKVSRYLRS